MTNRLQSKTPAESVVVAFTFETAGLNIPVTNPATASTVQWSLTYPEDPAPGDVLDGAPEVDPSQTGVVLQRVRAGVDYTDYRLVCTATTLTGDTLQCQAILPVRARPRITQY